MPVSTSDVPVSQRLPVTDADVARTRRIRRRILLVGAIVIVVAALIIAAVQGYRYTQTRYFVGADSDTIVIYQGVPQDAGPVSLSHVALDTEISLESLTEYERGQVRATISADSLADAQAIVARLAPETAP